MADREEGGDGIGRRRWAGDGDREGFGREVGSWDGEGGM